MRNMVEGSKMLRGRKKRTNIRKHVVRKPATAAQTIRRRILLTGGSGALSSVAPVCFAATGLARPLAIVGVGVEEALAAPSATRAAGVVPAGTSLASVASRTLPAGRFGLGLLSTPQTSICTTGDKSNQTQDLIIDFYLRASDADYTTALIGVGLSLRPDPRK